ncbi:MAG TPA: hypothetical protein VFX35_08025 [Solirubrobacterales bacterium]|nr:hypothetical protein [Solirubrobacterales bacterium]
MDEQEAKDRCAQLAAEHPDRETSNWVPVKQKDDSWAVVRIPLPPPVDPNRTQGTRRDPSPHEGEDVRADPWIKP